MGIMEKKMKKNYLGFPKIRATLFKGVYRGYIGIMEKKMKNNYLGFRVSYPLGVPIIRIQVYCGLYWGPLFGDSTNSIPTTKD